jgi:hypothetical protein
MQVVGSSTRHSNLPAINAFKAALSALWGAVVDFVNMEALQICMDGNLKKLLLNQFLSDLKSSSTKARFLDRCVTDKLLKTNYLNYS